MRITSSRSSSAQKKRNFTSHKSQMRPIPISHLEVLDLELVRLFSSD